MSTYKFGSGVPTWNGTPMIGGFPSGLTQVWYVDYGNGSDAYGAKSNSSTRAFQTIDKALDTVTTNKNEGIALVGNTTHTLTEMLSVTKNRVHIFGYDPGGRMYGQNAKISLGITGVATNIASIQNTGVRNSFSNVKIINSDTVAQGLYSFAEGGEYTVFIGCEFYKDTILDSATAAEVLMNGDSAQMFRCTIGSTANQTGGIRSHLKLTATLSGKKCRDFYAEDCLFLAKADDTDKVMVYGANATDVERIFMMKNCTFYNTKLAAGVPAHAVGFGAAQTEGSVILKDCCSVNCTVMAQAAVGIYVTGAVPTFATTGVSVAA